MSASNILLEKIERFARKFYVNRLIQGVLVGAVLWIVFFLLINGVEYFSWFPSRVRFVLWLFLLAVSAFVVFFYFLIPLFNLIRFRKKMSVNEAAVLIGRFFPDIQDKLLNTIQLTEMLDEKGHDELLVATIEQRTSALSPVRFSDAIDFRANRKYMVVFFGLMMVLLCLVFFFPRFAVQPAQRIINYDRQFEKPLPYQVIIEEMDVECAQGKDASFSIRVEGERIPDAFFVKSVLGQQMMTRKSVNSFEYVFRNLYDDLEFHVFGGEYLSNPLHITVRPNPVLLSYRCELDYPAYVHRNDETLEGKTHLILPQGTKVHYEFSARDVEEAFVLADSSCVSLDVVHNEVSYRFTSVVSGSFGLLLSNEWNRSEEPLSFSFDVIPDAYPDIRVESFDEALSDDVYFSGLISDDYGFSKLTFNCLIKEAADSCFVSRIAFDDSQSRTSFFYHFSKDSLGVLPGQELEVFFEVWDNDGFHGPKSRRSEVFSYYRPSEAALDSIADQKAEDILDMMSEKSKEAEKLQDDIEKMLQDLIQKKELDWSDKEKMKELVEKQREIQEEWERLHDEQEDLKEFMEKNSLANEDLLRKQEQINKLFDEVVPKELQLMMEELQKMLDDMPREQMQQILQDIKQNNQSMQELLDRNLALLEQLKMEKDLTDLADKLNELGKDLLDSEDSEKGDNGEAKTADEAKQQFDELMDELDQLLEKNQAIEQPFDVQKDDELQESIQMDLDDASKGEQSGDQQRSKQGKQKAGEKMQEMANSLMMAMLGSDMEQLAEDATLVRILLENVVHASHIQENLMIEIGHLKSDDPSLLEKIVYQKEIADNFALVRDSLRNMALRQPLIQNFIFDELHTIEDQTNLAMQYLNNLKLASAVRNQQTAMMAMNNLALMLAESLENMEDSMNAQGMPMQSKKPKPGKTPSMQQMQQLQKQLGEQLKQMQQQNQGNPGSQTMSEQLARMAAEQEMLRQGMQKMLQEMKENGQIGDDGLNDIIKEMEKLEEDIVNKRITHQTIERNRQILSRMLESQKAQEKRDQDESRKSNEYKGTRFDRRVDELIYEQSLKKNQEFLKKNPVEYMPFYKEKINEYYFRKNAN